MLLRPKSAGVLVSRQNATIPVIVVQSLSLPIAHGERVFFHDPYSSFTFANVADGLHPTQLGYAKLGDLWYQSILALVPEPSTVTLLRCAMTMWALILRALNRRVPITSND